MADSPKPASGPPAGASIAPLNAPEHEIAGHNGAGLHPATAGGVLAIRELFWNNVIREMLTTLSVLAIQRRDGVYDPEIEHAHENTFDGRLAIITQQGQRIPIAEVHPMLACSIPGSNAQKRLSMQVQCSVFQIRTPGGEIHILPIHEIRGFHTLTPELIERLKAQADNANGNSDEDANSEPFGFAAFHSLSRDQESGDLSSEAREA